MDGRISLGRRSVAALVALGAIVATVAPVLAHDTEEEVQRRSPPRPLMVLPDEGTIPVTGSYVVITMEFECLEEADLNLTGQIEQDSIIMYADQREYRFVDCAGTTATEDIILTGSQSERFRPGRAVVQFTGRICMNNELYLGCRSTTREGVLSLSIEGVPFSPPF